MLILTRKSDECIIINGNIEVKIVAIRGDQIRLGISATKEISIHRKEVFEAIQNENKLAATTRNLSIDALAQSIEQHIGTNQSASEENEQQGKG